MNSYCEWCRGRFPEEGCCLEAGGKCSWEAEKDYEINKDILVGED